MPVDARRTRIPPAPRNAPVPFPGGGLSRRVAPSPDACARDAGRPGPDSALIGAGNPMKMEGMTYLAKDRSRAVASFQDPGPPGRIPRSACP